jgi:hypothetical protein
MTLRINYRLPARGNFRAPARDGRKAKNSNTVDLWSRAAWTGSIQPTTPRSSAIQLSPRHTASPIAGWHLARATRLSPLTSNGLLSATAAAPGRWQTGVGRAFVVCDLCHHEGSTPTASMTRCRAQLSAYAWSARVAGSSAHSPSRTGRSRRCFQRRAVRVVVPHGIVRGCSFFRRAGCRCWFWGAVSAMWGATVQ